MRTKPSRREVTKWMFSATLGDFLARRLEAGAELLPRGTTLLFREIRNQVEQAIARGEATGMAVSVIRGGRIVWEEGFGWADREAGIKATPDTPFSMASITKPFTTTTLMTLVAEGKLPLDGSANQFLGDSKIFGENGDPTAATVRMLGAHISGLPGIYESYDDAESRLIPSSNDELKEYGRLAYPPGSVYEYSNIGYAALDAIASSLVKTEFGSLMQARVLTPLGLKNSFFGSDRKRVPSGASRYDPFGQPIPHYRTSTPASGELFASAHDLARFLLFNMGQHAAGEASILAAPYLAEFHRPVFTGPSGIASTFGWFQGQTASGVRFFFKTGGDPGVANRVCFVPSRGLGCVVVTNQSTAAPLAYSICDEIMRSELPDWSQPVEYCGFPSAPLSASDKFVGRWYGSLENDGVSLPVHLHVQSAQTASLAVGTQGATSVAEIRAEGQAFVGTASGYIASPDVLRVRAHKLQIKLFPKDNRLIGRVFAVSGDLNVKNATLPYVLNLKRQNPD